MATARRAASGGAGCQAVGGERGRGGGRSLAGAPQPRPRWLLRQASACSLGETEARPRFGVGVGSNVQEGAAAAPDALGGGRRSIPGCQGELWPVTPSFPRHHQSRREKPAASSDARAFGLDGEGVEGRLRPGIARMWPREPARPQRSWASISAGGKGRACRSGDELRREGVGHGDGSDGKMAETQSEEGGGGGS